MRNRAVERRPTRALARLATLVVAGSCSLSASAGEREVQADLTAYFQEAAPQQRARVAERIAGDPSFRREKLRDWLNQLPLHPERPAGRTELRVDIGLGQWRRVALRVPRGYTPARAWPLVYALHFSGGSGPAFISRVEALLGERVEEFVLAAPSDHRQTGLDAPPPFTADHPAILRAVRRAVHVDAGRQYALGYSLGGYAAWAAACLHGDELAGAVPQASAAGCLPPTGDGLWRALMPNVQSVPILNVWGERDGLVVHGVDGQPVGSIAELNRRFVGWSKGLAPLLSNVALPGRGHGDVAPPVDRLMRALEGRRRGLPRRVEHRFRHLHQGRAYWLEAHSWTGPHWGPELPTPEPRAGESREQALGRELEALLGLLHGEVRGQTITVETRHVGDLTVWLDEGLLDWSRPVKVVRDGRVAFEGVFQADLRVCLEEAARRLDFERLRWAGLRLSADGSATPVTGDTPFPPLLP